MLFMCFIVFFLLHLISAEWIFQKLKKEEPREYTNCFTSCPENYFGCECENLCECDNKYYDCIDGVFGAGTCILKL
eukprot:Pgem_evm1s5094